MPSGKKKRRNKTEEPLAVARSLLPSSKLLVLSYSRLFASEGLTQVSHFQAQRGQGERPAGVLPGERTGGGVDQLPCGRQGQGGPEQPAPPGGGQLPPLCRSDPCRLHQTHQGQGEFECI